MSDERLKLFCPFCDGEVKIVVCDSGGNIRTDEYENDPWSGLGFKLYHDETMTNGQDCPIAGHKGNGTLGMYIYDTREEAIGYWNTRKPMERIVERLEDKFVSTWDCGYEGGYKDAIVDAIKIVKGGGVDE